MEGRESACERGSERRKGRERLKARVMGRERKKNI